MSVVLLGSTSGSITLQEPAVAGSTVLSLPAVSGTILTTATPFSNGQGPAFSAWQSSAQTLSNATFTKINFQTEEFDTNNNFASSRFTPTVAGYYQVCAFIYFGNILGDNITAIFKNGGNYKRLNNSPTNANASASGGTCIVYCNGTTDYIEVYGYQVSGGNLTIPFALSDLVYFQASMVRGA